MGNLNANEATRKASSEKSFFESEVEKYLKRHEISFVEKEIRELLIRMLNVAVLHEVDSVDPGPTVLKDLKNDELSMQLPDVHYPHFPSSEEDDANLTQYDDNDVSRRRLVTMNKILRE